MKSVSIVDYGAGNLFSVSRAVEHCGGSPVLVSGTAQIEAADWLILPGVGAFADGMAGLRALRLIEPLRQHAQAGKPLLGICLGMQMLMEWSLEFGRHEGLGIIPGGVVPVPDRGAAGAAHKVPLVGWSPLEPPAGHPGWDGTILRHIPLGAEAYFVHSFMAVPTDAAYRLAETDYDGIRICAAIGSGRTAGCQFHPEKSGRVGLGILQAFLN